MYFALKSNLAVCKHELKKSTQNILIAMICNHFFLRYSSSLILTHQKSPLLRISKLRVEMNTQNFREVMSFSSLEGKAMLMRA